MDLDTARSYLVFGTAFVVSLIIFVRANHLWKDTFRKQSIVSAMIVFLVGIVVELIGLLNLKHGLALVVMSVPAIYLSYFLIGRFLFKRRYRTEPYVTSSSSIVGGSPLDIYTGSGKNGRKRKFGKDRRIMTADFVFSFAHALGAIFTIIFLLYFVNRLNS